MSVKYDKIKKELSSQYTNHTLHKDGYYGECWNDFDKGDSHGSMKKAFERGMDNYSNIIENAIKVWAKEHDMNASSTLGQIMYNIDVSKIKLLK